MGLIRSPDGRVWKLDRFRPKLSDGETFKIPFFWTSVVATILLLAFAVRVIWVDPGWVTYLLLLPLGVWIVERGLHAFRPFIRAETEGPPHELLMWRPGSRFAYGRVERRIVGTTGGAVGDGRQGRAACGLWIGASLTANAG